MDAYNESSSNLLQVYKGIIGMKYLNFVRYTQMDLIIEPLLSYMNAVNNLSHEEFESISQFHLRITWRRWSSLLPLVFRFPPSITIKSDDELVGLLNTFIIMKHSSDDDTEQKNLLDRLRDKLNTIENFVKRHEMFPKTIYSEDRNKIIRSFRIALESSYRVNGFEN